MRGNCENRLSGVFKQIIIGSEQDEFGREEAGDWGVGRRDIDFRGPLSSEAPPPFTASNVSNSRKHQIPTVFQSEFPHKNDRKIVSDEGRRIFESASVPKPSFIRRRPVRTGTAPKDEAIPPAEPTGALNHLMPHQNGPSACGMYLTNLLRSYHAFRVGAATKFVLFFLFTVVYIYIAINSMPTRAAKRGSSTRNTNITSKIINRIEEQGIDLYAIEEEMALRRDRLNTVCQRLSTEKPPIDTGEFIVDAHHSLVWCKVLKAASSTWINYFNVLGGFDEAFLRATRQKPWALLRSKFPKPTVAQLMKALKSSLSFIIVRDPLERLLSIYNTIISPANHWVYQKLKQRIKKVSRGSILSRGTPKFSDFVKYVIHTKDSHEQWSPMYKLCAPCSINFTVVAKFETLQDDQEYVIRRAGVDDVLKPAKVKLQFLAHRADETKDLKLQERYSQLDGTLILELLEMYRLDFELFGYSTTKYYYMIKELVIK